LSSTLINGVKFGFLSGQRPGTRPLIERETRLELATLSLGS
jgi:hypothetical protein